MDWPIEEFLSDPGYQRLVPLKIIDEAGSVLGNLMCLTERPCCSRVCASFSHCVDLPARSRPSITMRAPRVFDSIVLDRTEQREIR